MFLLRIFVFYLGHVLCQLSQVMVPQPAKKNDSLELLQIACSEFYCAPYTPLLINAKFCTAMKEFWKGLRRVN